MAERWHGDHNDVQGLEAGLLGALPVCETRGVFGYAAGPLAWSILGRQALHGTAGRRMSQVACTVRANVSGSLVDEGRGRWNSLPLPLPDGRRAFAVAASLINTIAPPPRAICA